jgi:hypothetical protein
MPRPKNIENPVRRMVGLPEETAKPIDYRFKHRIKTEAMRRPIEARLEKLALKPKKP